MLAMLDSSADSVKRAYTSFMDFAVVPFFYATWYDETLFKDPNWFTYIYLASVGLTFVAKEVSHRYKEANPNLSEEDYHKLVKFIDSFFEGLSAGSQLAFPAIIIDVIYGVKELFSAHSLKIIHPSFLTICGSYGLYKGIEKYGFFKPSSSEEAQKLVISDGSRLSINSSEDLAPDYSHESPVDFPPDFSQEEMANEDPNVPVAALTAVVVMKN